MSFDALFLSLFFTRFRTRLRQPASYASVTKFTNHFSRTKVRGLSVCEKLRDETTRLIELNQCAARKKKDLSLPLCEVSRFTLRKNSRALHPEEKNIAKRTKRRTRSL